MNKCPKIFTYNIPEADVQQRVTNWVNKYLDKAADIFNIRLVNVTISWFDNSTTAGLAYGSYKVSFNRTLAIENPIDFENTVCHEVAHLIVNMRYLHAKQAHGPEFRYVMHKLGQSNASTYHSYSTESIVTKANKKQFIYKCKDECTIPLHSLSNIRHKRAQNNSRKYYCAHCHAELVYTNKQV